MKLWIARTKPRSSAGGSFLGLFEGKPYYNEALNLWYSPMGLPIYIDFDLFPEVTFENSPQKVELKMI